MSEQPSVVVVGAGAIGLCTAFELHELGVARRDRDREAPRSERLVRPRRRHHRDAVPRPGADRDPRLLDGVLRPPRARAGLPITRNGYLRLGQASRLETFERSVEIQREHGVADATVLDRDQIAALVPDMVCDDILGGLYGPSDGFVDPALTCNILADLLRANGVTILQQTELVGADVDADGRHVLETTGGTLHCDHVVNAAGAWATPVGALLGDAGDGAAAAPPGAVRAPAGAVRLHDDVGDGLPPGLGPRRPLLPPRLADRARRRAPHGGRAARHRRPRPLPPRRRRPGVHVGRRRAARRAPARVRRGRAGRRLGGHLSDQPRRRAVDRPARRPADGACRVRRRRLGLPVGAGHRPQASRSGSSTASRRRSRRKGAVA